MNRGSGIARAISDAARMAGATVINAGRDVDALAAAHPGERVDLADDASTVALASRVGTVDHIVSTASAGSD